MNCAFTTSESNDSNPLDFQRVAPTANMLSYSFTFYAPHRYQSLFFVEAIRRFNFFTSSLNSVTHSLTGFVPLGAGRRRRPESLTKFEHEKP